MSLRKTVKIKAYAKINWFLTVTGLREDGYHLLSTVMQSVGIYDTLTIKKADKTSLKCDKEISGDNIVLKALGILEKEVGRSLPVKITLKKRIPMQAGMGGGSADAAAVFIGVNRLYGLRLSKERLAQISVKCGADVPFAIMGGTALAEGIGEKLKALPAPPKCYLLIAKPEKGNSTPEIFKRFDKEGAMGESAAELFEEALIKKDLSLLCECVSNSLEPVADADGRIKELMLENGAIVSAMTGSGTAIFGVFEDKKTLCRAYGAVRKLRRVTVIKTKPVNFE